eukprot:8352737-Pyramimonas_sp.AAC.1
MKLSESGFSASTDLAASIISAAGLRHHPRASAVRQIQHVASLSARLASVACRRTRPIVAISVVAMDHDAQHSCPIAHCWHRDPSYMGT